MLAVLCASTTVPAETASSPPPSDDAVAIASCGGRVQRSGGTLQLTIARGSVVEFQDNVDEHSMAMDYHKYELSECADDLGLFVVWIRHYESSTQMLVNQTTGYWDQVVGPIHVSPSKRAFVVVEPFSSGGQFWDFGIDVFHRRPDGAWRETWRYHPPDFSGREFLSWEGEGAVRISTATWKGGPLVVGHETVLRVSPVQFLREDGPERILRDEKGYYVDHIPGEQ